MVSFKNFFAKLIISIAIICLIGIGIYVINDFFKIWNNPLENIQSQLKEINKIFFSQIAAGISVGALCLLLIVFLFPFFTKKVDTKGYIKNVILGIISSFVFFISQSVYQYFEKIGKFYMIISIVIITILTIIIVEVISLIFQSKKDGHEFRTIVLAGIASGLIFGIILKIALIIMDSMKILVK